MPYPTLRPTGRDYDPGNWPVKTFNAQNGTEVRVLYGNLRHGMTMSLTYSNISDAQADQFLQHYDETQGTFRTFTIHGQARAALLSGWYGPEASKDVPPGVSWRYAEPPKLQSIRPGVSSVNISLVGVI